MRIEEKRLDEVLAAQDVRVDEEEVVVVAEDVDHQDVVVVAAVEAEVEEEEVEMVNEEDEEVVEKTKEAVGEDLVVGGEEEGVAVVVVGEEGGIHQASVDSSTPSMKLLLLYSTIRPVSVCHWAVKMLCPLMSQDRILWSEVREMLRLRGDWIVSFFKTYSCTTTIPLLLVCNR